ncbi:MAG TPA: lysylphosphatidylglycerol synthase transmembrane domain-containing protein [Gemmatimonadaceae bacterium]
MTPFRWFLTTLSFAAAIGAALWVISSHWPEGGAPLGLPWWGHLLALGAVSFELFFRSAKIAFSARACGIPLALGTAARATLGGDFASAVTPSRLGAEPARFVVLTEAGVPAASALLVLFLELFVEMISLLIIGAGLLLIWSPSLAMAGVAAMVSGYATVVLGLGAVAYVLSRRRVIGPPPRWARAVGINAGVWRSMRRGLRHLRGSVDAMRTANWRIMLLSLTCSVVHILGRLTILPIIIHAYGGGVELTALVLWPLVLLYGGALIPAPAGGGAMELGFNAVMDDLIPPALLGASLIWWRLYSYYIYVLLGAFAAGRTAMRALSRRNGTGAVPAGASSVDAPFTEPTRGKPSNHAI